jgi:hypothetical protein
MKRKFSPQEQKQKPAGLSLSRPADEVARRACFSHVNQNFPPEHDMQHWLEAEMQVLVESKPHPRSWGSQPDVKQNPHPTHKERITL